MLSKKTKHTGVASKCKACAESKHQPCPYCNHKLTGRFTKDGRTVCQFCHKRVWLGVGNYND